MTLFRLAFAALVLSAGHAAADIPVISDNWEYDSDLDEFSDSASTVAWTEQAEGLDRIRIELRCDTFNGLSAAVTFQEYIAADVTPVRYRVDDGEIVHENWRASPGDRAVLFAENPAMLAWRMMKGGRLYIEAQKDRGDPTRLMFKTGDGDAEIYHVMRDCDVYQDRPINNIPLIGNAFGAGFDPKRPDSGAEMTPEPAKKDVKKDNPKGIFGHIGSVFKRDKDDN